MKKTILTAEEIAAVILERKEEMLKLWAPTVCRVSEASSRRERTASGWLGKSTITATMFCPVCEQWGETETGALTRYETNLVCPHCGKIYTQALIGDNFSITDVCPGLFYSIALTYGKSTYLARMSINFVYNDKCELDIKNSTFKFQALGYYNPETKTKTKYVLKYKGQANEALVKTTAKYQTLFYYWGDGLNCQSVDGEPIEFVESTTCHPLFSMDKSFAEKKKETGPIDPPEEAKECPHIKYKDII